MAPIASTLLIVITSLISFLAFEDPAMEAKYIFRPEDILARKEYYRLLTAGFLYAGWAHLLSMPSDWLIQEIEVQVGNLEKDKSGVHDWLDKFGRTYDVIVGRPDGFEPQSFTASVLHRLKQPGVNFVIVDTRQLPDSQVDLLRPLFAQLPDAEFNRVIRSFAFKQR
jgi:hypothetical protein